LEFVVGDHVYLKVSPMKGMKRFGMKGKLAPHYIGPFPILEECGNVTYRLELSPSLAGVHDIFYISQLKKCLNATVDVVLPEVAPLEVDLTYPEHSIKILDQKSRVTTIRLKKQHGKMRISSVLAIQISSYRSEGACDCSLSL
jgi:hypothetical protein